MKYFLSTSLDREMRFYYLGDYVDPHEPSLIPVLIEIHLENKICSSNCVKPFANITEQSYFAEAEKEVLFMRTLEQAGNSVNHVIRSLCRLDLGSSYELSGQLKLAFKSYR
ncbi:unnamed protein product, partial [Rotaria sp. Silwood2]